MKGSQFKTRKRGQYRSGTQLQHSLAGLLRHRSCLQWGFIILLLMVYWLGVRSFLGQDTQSLQESRPQLTFQDNHDDTRQSKNLNNQILSSQGQNNQQDSKDVEVEPTEVRYQQQQKKQSQDQAQQNSHEELFQEILQVENVVDDTKSKFSQMQNEESGEDLDSQEYADAQSLDSKIDDSAFQSQLQSQQKEEKGTVEMESQNNNVGKRDNQMVVGVIEVGFVDLTVQQSSSQQQQQQTHVNDPGIQEVQNALKNYLQNRHEIDSAQGGQDIEQLQSQQQIQEQVQQSQQVEQSIVVQNEIAKEIQQKSIQNEDHNFEDVIVQEDTEDTQDGTVRCRTSRICDNQVIDCTDQNNQDNLACVTSSEVRQKKVREAAKKSWAAYRHSAWGKDELLPISNTSHTWFDLGLTLIDGLDTLLIMDLWEEFIQGREWVQDSLDFNREKVNLFETTIRILGGLEAAFHLSGGDKLFATKSAQLLLRLLPAFDSPTGIPWADAHLTELKGYPPEWSASSSLSETTTLTLEFTYGAQIMQRADFAEPALQAWNKIGKMKGKVDGLAPIYVNPKTGSFDSMRITLGARGDSYYEYMLKNWLLSGKKNTQYRNEYVVAMQGIRKHLISKTAPDPYGLWYVGELDMEHNQRQFVPKMDHLVCFLPGLLALGHFHGVETRTKYDELSDLELARKLMYTCYELYHRSPTGLASEIVHFQNHLEGDYPKEHSVDIGGGDFVIKPRDAHNLLRPETVESLFIMYRVTGENIYREWGWQIFRAFDKYSKLEYGGYTNLDTVVENPPRRRDKMESFWIAETIKYLYLLFDDDNLLPLDQYVFNTEAHPLPILGSDAEIKMQSKYLPQIVDSSYIGQFGTQHLLEQIKHYEEYELREVIAQQDGKYFDKAQ
eukprot:TRINITY_DN9036_c1_g1_i2.p1 TRINITY_DN9036_c1_g1~~TRINITY_DN9036_c1_g1_i2.p1  ORF type:complete len:917 (-),score=101.02 TRINITY_DN9036_c1_g1_i2:320-2995(-)